MSGGHGPCLMASAVARAYNGGLKAEPPVGSRGTAPGQKVRGVKPPEAEALLVFGRSMEAANLSGFQKIWKGKKIKNLCYLCKKSWVATKLGGLEQTGRGAQSPLPRPGPKTATGHLKWCFILHSCHNIDCSKFFTPALSAITRRELYNECLGN